MEECSKVKSKEEQPTSSTTVSIPPVVPFPQWPKTNKLDKDFEKRVKIIFKQLHINILFADIVLQIPSYVKFLKEIRRERRNWRITK